MTSTEVFARKSSGLVRVMSPYSAFAYNVLNIGIIFPYVYVAVGSFPDANIPLAILLCGIFTAFLSIVYSGVAAAMPRTGGDYSIPINCGADAARDSRFIRIAKLASQ